MAKAFNLTAEINLRGPANLDQTVSKIKKAVSNINANIKIDLDRNTASNIASVNAKLRELNKEAINASSGIRSLNSALAGLNSSLSSVASSSSSLKQINNQVTTLTSSSRSISKVTSEIEYFGQQAGQAVRRFAAFSGATVGIYALNNAITDGFSEFIKFNKEVIKLSQVTNTSLSGLQDLTNEITRLSTSLGVGSSDLLAVASTLAQAGLSATDTKIALEALAKSSLAPSFDTLSDTTEGAIAILRQFGLQVQDLEPALGSINAVSAAFAVESRDLIAAIQRTGGVFASSSRGVSGGTDALNEFLAVFTSIRATTRESAETIATGLRTIFTRIQRGKTIEALKEYGVNLQDLEGKFVGPYEAVKRLSEGLSSLDPRDVRFSAILEELGGFRQIGKVIPLIQQFATAEQALAVAQKGTTSLTKDSITAQLSFSNQLTKTRESFLALIRELGDSTTFKAFIQGSILLADGLIGVTKALKPLLPLFASLATIKLASIGSQFVPAFFGPGGLRPNLSNRSMGGPILRFNKGGIVPGSGKGDKVPALLEPGEVVMNNRAANKYGRGNLVSMNKYPTGGPVKASVLKNIPTLKDRIQSAKSNIDEKDFKSGYYLTDSDSIIFTKNEFGVAAKPNIGFRKFEEKVHNIVGGTLKSGNYPIDIINSQSQGLVEVRNRNKTTRDEVLLSKLLRHKLAEGENLIKNNKTQDNNLDAGEIGVAYNTGKLRRSRFEILEKFSGGPIQTFAKGGTAQRRVGYIDYDVIANQANASIVDNEMQKAGVKGPRLYTDYLTDLAIKSRKESNIEKLRAIYGVAGSGKTTLAKGQGTDTGTLRETTRFPILSPEDIKNATEILVLSSSVPKDKLGSLFKAMDRVYTLSSTTTSEQERIISQRESRDISGIGLEGRKPGTTIKSASDTAVAEALLGDALGNKSIVLGRTESGMLRRKSKNELVEIIKKKIGFTWGGFAPTTLGHESIIDSASAYGIPPEDFIALVGSNEGIADPKNFRTAIFDQDARILLAKAGFGARGATVLSKPKDFEVPQAFDVSSGNKRRVIIPTPGSTAFVADKTEKDLAKYKASGYEAVNLSRSGGISGTTVRDLIAKGDLGELQKILSPGVYELISNNIDRIQNRANILPSLIQQVQQSQAVSLAEIEKQIDATGIKRADRKKAAVDAEYSSLVEVYDELRKKRDKIKDAGEFEPYKLLAKLAADQPEKYGLDFSSATSQMQQIRTVGKAAQKFMNGGIVPSMVSNGEAFVPPALAKKIGYSTLNKMNNADRGSVSGFAGGGISIFKGSGSGTSDSIGPIGLPEGSFIIREKATKALSLNNGGFARFQQGKSVQTLGSSQSIEMLDTASLGVHQQAVEKAMTIGAAGFTDIAKLLKLLPIETATKALIAWSQTINSQASAGEKLDFGKAGVSALIAAKGGGKSSEVFGPALQQKRETTAFTEGSKLLAEGYSTTEANTKATELANSATEDLVKEIKVLVDTFISAAPSPSAKNLSNLPSSAKSSVLGGGVIQPKPIDITTLAPPLPSQQQPRKGQQIDSTVAIAAAGAALAPQLQKLAETFKIGGTEISRGISGLIEGVSQAALSSSVALASLDISSQAKGITTGLNILVTGLSSAVAAYTSAQIDKEFASISKSFGSFNTVLKQVQEAPTKALKQDAAQNLQKEFVKLSSVTSSTATKIKSLETVNRVSKAFSDFGGTILVTTIALSSLRAAAASAALAQAANAGTSGAGAGAFGAIAGTIAKFFGPWGQVIVVGIGLVTSLYSLLQAFNVFGTQTSKTTEALSQFDDALLQTVENSIFYNKNIGRYADVLLKEADKALRETRSDPTARQSRFGQIPTSREENTDLNLVFGEAFRAELAKQNIFVPLEKSIQQFVEDLQNVGGGEIIKQIDRIQQQFAPTYLENRFQAIQKKAGIAEGSTQRIISKAKSGDLAAKKEIMLAVSAADAAESTKKFGQDISNINLSKLSIPINNLIDIMNRFGSTMKLVSDQTSRSFDILDTQLANLAGQGKANITDIFAEGASILSNLPGASVGAVSKELDRVLNIIGREDKLVQIPTQIEPLPIGANAKGIIAALEKQTNQRNIAAAADPTVKAVSGLSATAKQIKTQVLTLQKLETDFPVLVREFASQPGGLGGEEFSSAITALFSDVLQASNVDKQTLESLISKIQTEIQPGQQENAALNLSELAGRIPELSKILDGAKASQEQLIQVNTAYGETLKKLGSYSEAYASSLLRSIQIQNDVQQIQLDTANETDRILNRRPNFDRNAEAFQQRLRNLTGLQDVSVTSIEQRLNEVNKQIQENPIKNGETTLGQGQLLAENRALVDALNQLFRSNINLKTATDKLAQIQQDASFEGDIAEKLINAINTGDFTTLAKLATTPTLIAQATSGEVDMTTLSQALEAIKNLPTATQAALRPLMLEKNRLITPSQQQLPQATANVGAALSQVEAAGEAMRRQEDKTQKTILDTTNKIWTNFNTEMSSILSDTVSLTKKTQDSVRASIEQEQKVAKTKDINMVKTGAMESAKTALSTYTNLFSEETQAQLKYTNDSDRLKIHNQRVKQRKKLQEQYDINANDIANATTSEQVGAALDKLVQDLKTGIVSPSLTGIVSPSLGSDLTTATPQQRGATASGSSGGRGFVGEIMQTPPPSRPLPPPQPAIVPTPLPSPSPPIPSQSQSAQPSITNVASTLNDNMFTFLDRFKKDFGDANNRFDISVTTLGNSFPIFSTSVTRFSESVDKLLVGLTEFNAKGGIKGPSIPEKVVVNVEFDENLIVDAGKTANNQQLLDQIGVFVNNKINESLSKFTFSGG